VSSVRVQAGDCLNLLMVLISKERNSRHLFIKKHSISSWTNCLDFELNIGLGLSARDKRKSLSTAGQALDLYNHQARASRSSLV
jgi:hypothetical protein